MSKLNCPQISVLVSPKKKTFLGLWKIELYKVVQIYDLCEKKIRVIYGLLDRRFGGNHSQINTIYIKLWSYVLEHTWFYT